MKLGIGSYTYPWAIGMPGSAPTEPLTPLGLLERARTLGVDVVQFCDNLPLTGLGVGDLETLAGRADDDGLEIEIGTRGISRDDALAHLALARRLRSKLVRFVIDKRDDRPSPEEAVARIGEWLPEFIASDIRVAIENHDRFSVPALRWMVEALGASHCGICLDTVNSFGALEMPADVVPALAPYTLNLHVKDFVITRIPNMMGFEVTGCAAGKGRLDIPWVLGCLQDAGRDVNAVIELWTPRAEASAATIAREHRWAEESVAYLRTLISGVVGGLTQGGPLAPNNGGTGEELALPSCSPIIGGRGAILPQGRTLRR